MKYKVSIVIPIYNQEEYLDISIPAVINQEYNDIEIIAVNDGSTDKSNDILQKYAILDSRIRIIKKDNGGLVDATLIGIHNATGDYICFLDPDDTIGPDFISNFMMEIDDCDFLAMGFYETDHGLITANYLKEDKIYEAKELMEYRKSFLVEPGIEGISNRFFISRWNKFYRMECIKKVSLSYSQFKNISLGEDTIFTYLVLLSTSKGKTVSIPNSYYYNKSNVRSMMNSGDVKQHMIKAHNSYEKFHQILKENGDDPNQANALYYFLVNALVDRVREKNLNEFLHLYRLLHKDPVYKQGSRSVKQYSVKSKIKRFLWNIFRNPKMYLFTRYILNKVIFSGLRNGKSIIKGFIILFKDLKKSGSLMNALRLSRFRSDRRNAFRDLVTYLPVLEERIIPIIKPYMNKKTLLSECKLERNVFVFWWDGFEYAPEIVKACLKSIKLNHPEDNLIEIDKNNFELYTDIHPFILKNFRRGKISVQTFSDILRFNLLKNNGGVWIDATIFFFGKFDMLNNLESKSFESLIFSTSSKFLEYKEEKCSWSGYYIASRKNAVFVSVMNEIFTQYYLKYQTYSIYFFIDAALMICKINKIDNDVLSKIQLNNGDMFLLSKIINKEFSLSGLNIMNKIPQKLNWTTQLDTRKHNSFYQYISNGNSH